MSQNSAAVREKQKRLFSCGRLNGAFAVRPPFLKKQATPSPGRKELGRADAQAAKLLDIEGRGRKNAKGRPEMERGGKKKATMKNSLSLSTPGLFTFCCTLEADGGPQGAVASRPVNELEGEKRGIVSEKGRRTR